MRKTEKICVFCGKPPESKNKEHVIPRWLIEYTGVTNEKVRFGFDKHTGLPRTFTYNAFTFPACESCNSQYAKLENDTKPILINLLSGSYLSSSDMHCLLNWFDKVRIGLWIGFYYLDNNIGGITPKFHINARMGAHDRMMHIVKIENETKELSFRGCDTLSFHFAPCCFSMTINKYCFYNISSPFLFSRRIGFPYPSKSYLRTDGYADFSIEPARKRIMRPLLRKSFAFNGVGIYQPIYKSLLHTPYIGYLQNDYVETNSISVKDGIGKIFLHAGNTIRPYPSEPTMDWCPTISYNRTSMNPAISIDTLKHQLYIEGLMPSTEKLPENDKRWWRDTRRENRKYANWLINTMKQNSINGIY